VKSKAAESLADVIEKAVAPRAKRSQTTPIDASGDPITIARELLAETTVRLAELSADSPRLNGARSEARALTKLISALERERAAGVESPEELERRRRVEDGETRAEIERYVLQAEREAAARGVCVHCGAQVQR
jgi:hypothetical protein